MRNLHLPLALPVLLLVACGADGPTTGLGPTADGDVGWDTHDEVFGDTAPDAEGGDDPDVDNDDTVSADTPLTDPETDAGSDPDTGPSPDTEEDTSIDDGPLGWIGSPCEHDDDCDFTDGECLAEEGGHPGGMCSVACDRICPDQDGFPVTFCTDTELTDGGYCHTRCDYGLFPGVGCRDGYMCAVMPRYGEPETEVGTCVVDDGTAPAPSECIQWLIDHEVSFEPVTYAPRAAEGHPDLICSIQDPLRLRSPVNGIEYWSPWDDGDTPASMLMSCELARSVYKMGDILTDYEIVEVEHLGTQNCRVIAGTDTLSEHSFGRAIDIATLINLHGERYSVLNDWERDTDSPASTAARVLYAFAHRIFDEGLFNIVLTPNFNDAHANHLHIDLTPGGHFIKELQVAMGD